MEKNKQKKKPTAPKQQEFQGFLQKVFKILETEEYKDMITWTEDGTSFKVLKPTEFSEKVLPNFFKTNKFTSFVRQLNMYDFHKVSKIQDTDENEWKHPNFIKDRPDLLSEIKRKISDKNQKIEEQNGIQLLQQDQKELLDTKIIFKEIDRLSAKQDVLEKACQILITQNNQILSENKILWSEMAKNRDRQDRKLEKLIQLIFMFFQNGGNNKININQRNQFAGTLEDANIDDIQSQFHDKQPLTNKQKQAIMKQIQNTDSKEAEKMLKKLVKNINGSLKQPKNQFESFVDTYHQNNTDLLKNMQMCLEDQNTNINNKRHRESIDYQYDPPVQKGQNRFSNKNGVPQNYIQRLEEQDKITEQNADLLLKSLENRIDSTKMFPNKRKEPLMITEKPNSQMQDTDFFSNHNNNSNILNNSFEEELPPINTSPSAQQLQQQQTNTIEKIKPIKKNSNAVQIQEETNPFQQMNANYEMESPIAKPSNQNLQKPLKKNNSFIQDLNSTQNNNITHENPQFTNNHQNQDFVKDFFQANNNQPPQNTNNNINNSNNVPQSPIFFQENNNDDFDNNSMLFLSRQPSLQKSISQNIDQDPNPNEINNNNNSKNASKENSQQKSNFGKKLFSPLNCRTQSQTHQEQDGVEKYLNNSNIDHGNQIYSHENSFFD